MRLLLTKIGLLDKDDQYTIIKIAKSPKTKYIKTDIVEHEEEVVNALSSTTINTALTDPITLTLISFKDDNQGSVVLAYNIVFHACKKYINI